MGTHKYNSSMSDCSKFKVNWGYNQMTVSKQNNNYMTDFIDSVFIRGRLGLNAQDSGKNYSAFFWDDIAY